MISPPREIVQGVIASDVVNDQAVVGRTQGQRRRAEGTHDLRAHFDGQSNPAHDVTASQSIMDLATVGSHTAFTYRLSGHS